MSLSEILFVSPKPILSITRYLITRYFSFFHSDSTEWKFLVTLVPESCSPNSLESDLSLKTLDNADLPLPVTPMIKIFLTSLSFAFVTIKFSFVSSSLYLLWTNWEFIELILSTVLLDNLLQPLASISVKLGQ
ncbi:MAG: hypothetical protein GBAus27B_000529 [Mycoplasmataceae bacterium]|nr:MAG: hypothetical protein GBAus27B_000529 [Mycoplasmataceae bacterium]